MNVSTKPLRVAFVHPDLGIGGAEKLIVDAAVALQDRGHDVTIFTSRHDRKRCFEETRDGTLKVHVLGDKPLPRHLFSSLHILFSILHQIHLLLTLHLSLLNHFPFAILFLAPIPDLKRFDVFVVDQLSAGVPLIRWLMGRRVVFYLHFPDKLLSGGREVEVDEAGRVMDGLVEKVEDATKKTGSSTKQRPAGGGGLVGLVRGLAKAAYRYPFDKLEEVTTGQADVILSNSHFTSRVYSRAFPSLRGKEPRVVYPCIKVEGYEVVGDRGGEGEDLFNGRKTFISLNRFEKKKNVPLAVEAFGLLRKRLEAGGRGGEKLRLIVAGGYDDALRDNIETLHRLQTLCQTLSLTHETLCPSTNPSTIPSPNTDVLFLLNFTSGQRTTLLTSPQTLALLYTPSNEHFGIVPIEAMICGLPVLGVNSGGPTETIVDTDPDLAVEGATGLLRIPDAGIWSEAMETLMGLSDEQRRKVAVAGKKRVRENFSSGKLGEELEVACREAVGMGEVGWEAGYVVILAGVVGVLAVVVLGAYRLYPT